MSVCEFYLSSKFPLSGADSNHALVGVPLTISPPHPMVKYTQIRDLCGNMFA